jgi:hypothetical protein
LSVTLSEKTTRKHFEIRTDRLVKFTTVGFGKNLPSRPGVYVVLVSPRSASEVERGFGELLFIGHTANLNKTIGIDHGGHPRFWWFISANAAEIGFTIEKDALKRETMCSELEIRYRPLFRQD